MQLLLNLFKDHIIIYNKMTNYHIESNGSWLPALQSQTETLDQCRASKKDINFVITDPVSGKSFNSVCSYHENHCKFRNLETGTIRNAVWDT